LQLRECNIAVVSGLSILDSSASYAFAIAGMTSSDGNCHSFDESANGYCRGEGCGAIILKRLSDAIRDGDGIYAVVRGSAVLQDGKSASLTAPNGLAQEMLLRSALHDAKVDASQVRYIEAHGTGTKLGDPIEVGAIASVFGDSRPLDDPLFISSVKANIGHLEAAAGMAGLFSAILTLQNEEASPNAQLKVLNAQISSIVTDMPLIFPMNTTKLNRLNEERLIVGVSSFGYSGTIAHVIIEEAPIERFKVSQNLSMTLSESKVLLPEYVQSAPETDPSHFSRETENTKQKVSIGYTVVYNYNKYDPPEQVMSNSNNNSNNNNSQ
jgi:acyl transferase domain-containing protein